MVNFYELFDKEKRLAGRKRLQAEMRKGHFDDFKVLRDTHGKLFKGSNKAFPLRSSGDDESLAHAFRGVDVMDPTGGDDDGGGAGGAGGGVGRVGGGETRRELIEVYPGSVRLLATAVRDGAQPMLDAWIDAWMGGVGDLAERNLLGVLELSVVDSFVMRLAPFRSMLYKKAREGTRGSQDASLVRRRQVFLFGNLEGYEKVLGMFENRLVGYVYLIDRGGRVRWRGCGFPDDDEVGWLVGATKKILKDGT